MYLKQTRTRLEVKKICQECGVEFYPLRYQSKQKYCSHRCAGRAVARLYNKKYTGKKHPSWKGGRYKDATGYIMRHYAALTNEERAISKPMLNGKRKIREHRLVVAMYLKRPLKRYEQVHHINGVKTDNRIENLELKFTSAHHGKVTCPYCKRQFGVTG